MPKDEGLKDDEFHIRRAAVEYKTPYITTVAAAHVAVMAIERMMEGSFTIKSLQEYHSATLRARISAMPQIQIRRFSWR